MVLLVLNKKHCHKTNKIFVREYRKIISISRVFMRISRTKKFIQFIFFFRLEKRTLYTKFEPMFVWPAFVCRHFSYNGFLSFRYFLKLCQNKKKIRKFSFKFSREELKTKREKTSKR